MGPAVAKAAANRMGRGAVHAPAPVDGERDQPPPPPMIVSERMGRESEQGGGGASHTVSPKRRAPSIH